MHLNLFPSCPGESSTNSHINFHNSRKIELSCFLNIFSICSWTARFVHREGLWLQPLNSFCSWTGWELGVLCGGSGENSNSKSLIVSPVIFLQMTFVDFFLLRSDFKKWMQNAKCFGYCNSQVTVSGVKVVYIKCWLVFKIIWSAQSLILKRRLCLYQQSGGNVRTGIQLSWDIKSSVFRMGDVIQHIWVMLGNWVMAFHVFFSYIHRHLPPLPPWYLQGFRSGACCRYGKHGYAKSWPSSWAWSAFIKANWTCNSDIAGTGPSYPMVQISPCPKETQQSEIPSGIQW